MPPKFVAEMSSTSTSNCRRSKRIASIIKSRAEGQSKKSEELSVRKKSVVKILQALSEQPSSTNEGEKLSSNAPESSNPSHTKVDRKPSCKKAVTKTQPKGSRKSSNSEKTKIQPASSNKRLSTSTKNSPPKRIKTDLMEQQETEDFSVYIQQLVEELSPDLTISEEALADMNIYLNHVFRLLAMSSAIHMVGRSGVSMTEDNIERAVVHVIEGDLAKYCIAEGRRGVKKWDEKENITHV